MTEAEQERAKVVAWLREDALRIAATPTTREFAQSHLASVQSRVFAATMIERGEHLKEREE